MFRLKQKHSPERANRLPPADGRKLLAQQSLARAAVGAVVIAVLACWLWTLLAMTTGRIFPWFSMLAGALIGLAVQRFGRGLTWHFPVLAALIGAAAAYAGNLMIGIFETGRYIEAAPVRVFGGLSMDTMRNFFRNSIGPIDHIYAFCAAGLAAFFANRRLKRHELMGLRMLEKPRD